MSEISVDELKKEIHAVLKVADLSVISAKKVREQVEKKLSVSLVNRKKEIDNIVMEFIEQQNDNAESDASDDEKSEAASESAEEASSEDDKKKKSQSKKRPQPTRKAVPKKKRKTLNASDSGTETDGGSDSDYEQPKKTAAKKKGAGGATSTGGRKITGFTRPYKLSPELSALMDAESLPRHEVVKKVWGIIKERNLYDPKNKQFAICDDDLLKVMGVKRFRTFAMLKYLKPHFIN